MSFARPAQPGGTAGRDPAGESTLPADVARGRATPSNGPGATGGAGARPTSGGRAGGTARTTGVGAVGAAVGAGSASSTTFGAAARAAALRAAETGEPAVTDTDWRRIGTLAVGVVVGALVGAGAALLLAPRSGAETRDYIARGARELRSRAGDSWTELGDELRSAARRRRRKLRRGITRGRWAVADLMDE